MPTNLTHIFPETALERILDTLERELIEASDADILEAANDLGMKPGMKGSAAFLGLRYASAVARPEDVVDAKWMLEMLNDPRRIWLATEALPQKGVPQAGVPSRSTSRGRPARKKAPRPRKGPTES